MSGTVWSKFFWSDWESDQALKHCSYAAQGLWMRMLCIAASHDPVGLVAVAGRPLDSSAIARMTGGSESEVDHLLTELDRNGVFSRDRKGRIYSRRMVSDAKKAETARENGKKGGNPNLGKSRENPPPDNPDGNDGLKGEDKTHKPEAIIPDIPPVAPQGASGPKSRQAEFERFWGAYPRKVAKRAAERAFESALRRATADQIVAGLNRAKFSTDLQYTPHPATWLNRDGWLDEEGRSPLRTSNTSEPAIPITWNGPPEVRAAIVAQVGEEWAAFWLDTRCTWQDLPEKAIVTRNETAASKFRWEFGREMRGLGCALVLLRERVA